MNKLVPQIDYNVNDVHTSIYTLIPLTIMSLSNRNQVIILQFVKRCEHVLIFINYIF